MFHKVRTEVLKYLDWVFRSDLFVCCVGLLWGSWWLCCGPGGLLPPQTHPAGQQSDQGWSEKLWPKQPIEKCSSVLHGGREKSSSDLLFSCLLTLFLACWRSYRCKMLSWSLKSLWRLCRCCATSRITLRGMAPVLMEASVDYCGSSPDHQWTPDHDVQKRVSRKTHFLWIYQFCFLSFQYQCNKPSAVHPQHALCAGSAYWLLPLDAL